MGADLSSFGLDSSALGESFQSKNRLVPGRTVHIDADFICYFVTHKEDESFDSMINSVRSQVDTIKDAAGADKYVMHLTAKGSTKGGRFGIQKEYQGNRHGKPKPKQLEAMRLWISQNMPSVYNRDQEADDSMCQANWQAILDYQPELSVIASKDKDLRMCAGYHLDLDTGDLIKANGYGRVDLKELKSSKKLVGWGTSFFWAQMLMGDGADNIQGLPIVHGSMMNRVKPTQKVAKAQEFLENASDHTEAELKQAQFILNSRKPGKCGPALAYEIIRRCKNDYQAFSVVSRLYMAAGELQPFYSWEDPDTEVKWKEVFFNEASMLWMRRYKDPNDFKKWLVDVVARGKGHRMKYFGNGAAI